MNNQYKKYLIRTTVLLLSILHLIGFYFFYREILVYKHENQLSSILTFLNTHLAENYFSSPKNIQINTILVKPEDDYCLRSDLYKYYHPQIVLEDTYTFREYTDLIQTVTKTDTFNCIPSMKLFRNNSKIPPKYTLPIQVTLPYTYYIQLVDSFIIGKSSLCLFQKFNHLPQRHSLSHKNNLVNNYFKQIDALKAINASSDCIKNASYIPPTYRLYVKDECQEFFKYVNSETYKQRFLQDGPQFLTKMGMEIHRGRGVTIILDDELIKLKKKYENGTKCGINQNLLIAQRYINNPFLYQDHKLEFRVYWVIASTNPLIVYAYGKEVIRKCGYKFDKFSKLRAVHLCNLSILKQDLKKQNIDYKSISTNEEGEELFIDWHLDGLQDLLLAKGRITDKNWLQNYLYPKIHKNIIHAVRSAKYTFAKDSKLAEFFATDFMLTDELDVYILEINYNPQTVITTPHSIVQHSKMVRDMLEIQNVYLRSKYLRFKQIIAKLLQKLNGKPFTKTIMNQKVLDEIKLAYLDKLDQNIQLKKGNLFKKIIDENEIGTKQYNDLIQTQCLYEQQ